MTIPHQRVLRRALALAAFGLACPAFVSGGNDTDGLIAEGLFPLAGGGTSLQIVAETVSLTLERDGELAIERTYGITNRGKTGMFRLGALCSQWTDPCQEIRIDGAPVPFSNRIGRLADREGHVEVQTISRAKIERCGVNNDGEICGHVWAEIPFWLERGGLRTVTIRFQIRPAENSFFDDVLGQLHFYTESFWRAGIIPAVEFRFSIEGAQLSKEVFKRLPDTSDHVMEPNAVDQGAVVWRLKNHLSAADIDLVQPHGIDLCALYKVYVKAGGRYPKWPKDCPNNPCIRPLPPPFNYWYTKPPCGPDASPAPRAKPTRP